MDKIIKHFKNMLSRELTELEYDMIRLSYNIGKQDIVNLVLDSNNQ